MNLTRSIENTVYTEMSINEEDQKLIRREINKKLHMVSLEEMDKYTITDEEYTKRRADHK